MLRNEAVWFGERLRALDARHLSPLLNVGSASAEFRTVTQPYIEDQIFGPLRRRGVAVEHLDLRAAEGVDIVGDLADADLVASLAKRRYRAVMSCSLLEHVPDPDLVCRRLERLVQPGGYLLISVPHRFPYHPDPIDTMFRPSPAELTSRFPAGRCVASASIACGTGWDYVGRDPLAMTGKVIRRLRGSQSPSTVHGTASFAPWLFRSFRMTCVILQMPPAPPAMGARDGTRAGGEADARSQASTDEVRRPELRPVA